MAKKKIGLKEILYAGAILILAIAIFINKAVPSKFVCEGDIIAEQLAPVDISNMFNNCAKSCDNEDKVCLTTCAEMVYRIVSAISGSGCQEYCVAMMNALQCPNCNDVRAEKSREHQTEETEQKKCPAEIPDTLQVYGENKSFKLYINDEFIGAYTTPVSFFDYIGENFISAENVVYLPDHTEIIPGTKIIFKYDGIINQVEGICQEHMRLELK